MRTTKPTLQAVLALATVAAILVVGCSAEPPATAPSSGSTSAPTIETSGTEIPPDRPAATMSPAPSGAATSPKHTAPELDPVVGCLTDRDCDWGEINRDIESSSDCMCLFGCPHIPMNVSTVKRRGELYRAHCRDGFNGNGARCPVDDCAPPPPIVCRDNVCQAK